MSSNKISAEKLQEDNRDSSKNYYAVDKESISCIAEQFSSDLKLSESITSYVADDVTFKIREMIHNARLRMQHTKRKVLKQSDIDAAMESSNIERMYGASGTYSASNLDSNGVNYFNYVDPTINLVDFVFESKTFIQDGSPYLKCKWLSKNNPIEEKYYENICKAVLSQNNHLSSVALKSLRNSKNVGNLVELFSKFCFFAFIVDKGNKKLILNMIRSLARNPSSSLSEAGDALKLICAVLISDLFSVSDEKYSEMFIKMELNEEIAQTLIILMNSWTSLEVTVLILLEKFIVKNPLSLTTSIISVLCSRGIEHTKILFWDRIPDYINELYMDEIYWPNVRIISKKILNTLPKYSELPNNLKHILLYASLQLFQTSSFTSEWYNQISILLGDSCIPLFPNLGNVHYSPSGSNRLNTKKIKITYMKTETKCKNKVEIKCNMLQNVFEDYCDIKKRPTTISYGTGKTAQVKRLMSISNSTTNISSIIETNKTIIIKKNTSSLKLTKYNDTCKNHNLLFTL